MNIALAVGAGETVTLLMQQSYIRAVANVFCSVLLCIGSTWIGIMLARQF